MTKNMDREHLLGLMENNMKGHGLTVNNMEKDIIQILKEKRERDYGNRDKE